MKRQIMQIAGKDFDLSRMFRPNPTPNCIILDETDMGLILLGSDYLSATQAVRQTRDKLRAVGFKAIPHNMKGIVALVEDYI